MSWLNPPTGIWELLKRAVGSTAPRKRRPPLRALLEQLETRLAPAVGFDPTSGLLSVIGDETGPSDDVIKLLVTRENGRFIDVTINDVVHSSRPGAPNFDPALDGAKRSTVLAIRVQGLQGNDTLLVGPGFQNADGHITVEGGAGADRIIASRFAELLTGGSGNDFISAGRGDDSAEGGAGDDMLLGGSGNDTLVGGVGTDSLDGGRGANELIEDGAGTGGLGCQQGTDEPGQDFGGPIIAFDVATGQLSVSGDNRTDDVISVILATGGFVAIEINGVARSSDPLHPGFFDALSGATEGTTTSILVRGLDGNDNIEVIGTFSAASGRITLQGGCGDDTLAGSAAAERLEGGFGQDQLSGADGNDILLGDEGADNLDGGTGEDTLVGAGGIDTLDGGAGDDYLAGGEEHREGLVPSVANDGIDFLNGGDGDLDLAYDPRGEDIQEGVELGLDIHGNHFQKPGMDTEGHPTTDASNHMAVATATALETTIPYFIDTADHGGVAMPAGMADRIREAAAAWATPQVSFVESAAGVHVHFAPTGCAVGQNACALVARLTTHSGVYPDGHFLHRILSGVSGITFLSGFNWYTGTATPAADQFDTLSIAIQEFGHILGIDHSPDANSATHVSGPGEVRRNLQAHDFEVLGELYNPGVVFASFSSGVLTVQASELNNVIQINSDGTNLDVTIGTSLLNNVSTLASTTQIRVFAGGGDDTITFGPMTIPASVVGGAGDDSIVSAGGNDTLDGGDGSDTIEGGAGNDSLIGGAGNDSYRFDVDSALGTDTVTENGGTDSLDFSPTDNVALTVNLSDTGSPQRVVNQAGLSLFVTPSNSIENVTGGAQSDTLTGDGSANTLQGGPGNDLLSGGAGNDTYLFADGWGQDTITESATDGTNDMATFANVSATTSLTFAVASGSVTQGPNSLSFPAGNVETLIGGNGNDIFNIASNATAVLQGGPGNDGFNFTTNGVVLMGSIDGQGGNDTITGDNAARTYNITGPNAGNIPTILPMTNGFTSVESLVGGSAVDGFMFATGGSLTGSINGGGDNDTITGDNSARTYNITGPNAGNIPTILPMTNGFTGVESLVGGSAGDSFVFATGGSLTGSINGGGANDTITGDNAVRTYNITGPNAGNIAAILPMTNGFMNVESLVGGSALDSFVFTTGGSLTGSINGGGANDTITGDNSARMYNITGLNAGNIAAILPMNNGFMNVESLVGGSAADNFMFAAGGTLDGSINGGGSNDAITGDNSARTYNITGPNAGNIPTILPMTNGFTSVESLVGGFGVDSFVFATGGTLDGSINGGNGNDTITGDNTARTYNITGANAGNISAILTSGWNSIEVVAGGAGDDTFNIGATFLGSLRGGSGSGDDVFQFTSSGLMVSGTINGEGGTADRLDYSGYVSVVSANLTNGMATGVFGGAFFGVSGIENLTGGSGNDFLTGDSNANVIIGGPGNDNLAGSGGDDTYRFDLDSALGTDTINDSSGTADLLDFSPTDTVAVTVNLGDTATPQKVVNQVGVLVLFISPVNMIENVTGGAQADNLTGNASANTLSGNAGNDVLTGGAGSDSLVGGPDDDTYIFADAGTGEIDTVNELPASGNDTLDFAQVTENLTVVLTNATNLAIHKNRTVNGSAPETLENVTGGSGNDKITGSTAANDLKGGEGKNTVVGGAGNDVILGGSGIDSLIGGADNDVVTGDSMAGRRSNDKALYGDDPIDLLVRGDDNLDGGSGNEKKLFGGPGFDTLSGGDGNDRLFGDDDDDMLKGDKGKDQLTGGSGTDSFDCGAGEDPQAKDILKDQIAGESVTNCVSPPDQVPNPP